MIHCLSDREQAFPLPNAHESWGNSVANARLASRTAQRYEHRFPQSRMHRNLIIRCCTLGEIVIACHFF